MHEQPEVWVLAGEIPSIGEHKHKAPIVAQLMSEGIEVLYFEERESLDHALERRWRPGVLVFQIGAEGWTRIR